MLVDIDDLSGSVFFKSEWHQDLASSEASRAVALRFPEGEEFCSLN
jgi:hypothetical protein